MGRYLSEAQRTDLKLRIGVGAVLLAIGIPVWFLGPGLESVLEHARAHKAEDWAAERYYQVAKVMEWTWRDDRAMQVYEEFYLLYCGSEILLEEDLFSELSGDPNNWYFLPWVEARYDGEEKTRPAPLSKDTHPLMGDVLIAVGNYYEGRRLYSESNHIFACLRTHWDPGSAEYLEGENGWIRSVLRPF